eukprot:414408_1
MHCAVIILITIICICEAHDTFDWNAILKQLQSANESWKSMQIDSYIYHFTFDSYDNCFKAPKFVAVRNNIVVYVEYDVDYVIQNGLYDFCDTNIEPKEYIGYYTIDQYYDMAIVHAQKGLEAECDHPEELFWLNSDECGGSEEFEYDTIFYFPCKNVKTKL